MEPFVREATNKTPYLNFNAREGYIQIKGRSIPENAHLLFDPIMEWLDKYISNPSPVTRVDIQLEYFNTISSINLLNVFKKINELYKRNNKATISWYCDKDDEDMIEAGEDYQAVVDIPIKIIEV
ncbi:MULTISPECIES: DUF1987 domain-containing protein [unclassified Carboxylicivirga]|uniref:DUF1987 domain-containing protein n=1 Tax=Carboxylicivirga TaxID=1628153 RepID=UPI003D333779